VVQEERKANSGAVATDANVTECAKAEMDGGGIHARELDNNQIYELGTYSDIVLKRLCYGIIGHTERESGHKTSVSIV
jgi:hypothetical protein